MPTRSDGGTARRGRDGSAPRPRRRDADVLAAAIKVFRARGYASATVQDVADELNILKGSLYHYIQTKEGLLFAIFQVAHRDVDAILDELETSSDDDPLSQIREYVHRMVLYNVTHIEQAAVDYRDMDELTGERLATLLESRRRHQGWIVTRICSEGNADALQSLKQGVENTLRELNRTLDKFGLKAIESVDQPFDPAYHHAMSQVEKPDVDDKTVLQEMRKGIIKEGPQTFDGSSIKKNRTET